MRSDNVKKGPERAPNRSLFYALGYTPEELERPLIGVVSAYSEIVPGHMNLDKLADAVKAGIRMAGGTPVLVPAIGVCDGIAMGHIGMKYSLASRELICDSVETMFMAHQLDGLVLVPNCDKIVPGMVMAAVRMDVPAIVCSGGPIGLIEEGDTIEINIPEASIHLAVSDEELARRKAAYVQPEPNVKSGWLARYARMVASANLGAVMQ